MMTILLVSGAVISLVFLLYAARGMSPMIRNPEEIKALTEPIDLDAFRNLVSPEEERFLRQNLSAREFRRIQRTRILAAIAYLRSAAHNAAVLLRLAEANRNNPDPAVAASAAELADSAIQMRIYAIAAMAKLSLGLIHPRFGTLGLAALEKYRTLTRSMTYFVSLSRPYFTSSVSDSI